jgi:hypothetical protein
MFSSQTLLPAYRKKVYTAVKIFHQYLSHITCVEHRISRAAKQIQGNFPKASTEKAFVKMYPKILISGHSM